MKAIVGLNTIFRGSIQLKGRELIGMPTEAISRLGIAYVPQRENIFTELNVLENLQLGARSLPRHTVDSALHELVRALPNLGPPQVAASQPAQRRRAPDAGDRYRLAQQADDHAAGRTQRGVWRPPSPPMYSRCCRS